MYSTYIIIIVIIVEHQMLAYCHFVYRLAKLFELFLMRIIVLRFGSTLQNFVAKNLNVTLSRPHFCHTHEHTIQFMYVIVAWNQNKYTVQVYIVQRLHIFRFYFHSNIQNDEIDGFHLCMRDILRIVWWRMPHKRHILNDWNFTNIFIYRIRPIGSIECVQFSSVVDRLFESFELNSHRLKLIYVESESV